VIVQEVSPVLNCPDTRVTTTVVPGPWGDGGVNCNIGVPSTVNGAVAKSPLLPVTVMVNGPGVAPVATVNEPVIFPVVPLTLHVWDVTMFVGPDEM
jgi:hypothetical protein